MKRILITGCAGFIGYNLADYLLKQGYWVIGVDNLITGKQKYLDKLLYDYENFVYYISDVSSDKFKQSLEKCDNYKNLDWIFHAASPASPPRYKTNSFTTIKVNTIGTEILAHKALQENARFMFFSTSEIYGDPPENKLPLKEEYYGNVNSFGPRSVYDESKRLGETICYEFHNKYGLDIRIPRIFNTFGPYMHPDDGRVVTNFIRQRLFDEEIIIYGDGKQTRCLLYVDDMVQALVKLMESDYKRPINLGSDNVMTIEEIGLLITEEVDKYLSRKTFQYPKKYYPIKKDDPIVRQPDLTLARKVLNWYPKVSLQDGLNRTIRFIDEELKNVKQ